MNLGFAAAVACSFLAVGCSNKGTNTAADRPATSANPPAYSDRGAVGTLSDADRDFAMKAAQGGMAEVEMGNLAQQQGSAANVKEFGRKLVQDHTKANNDLKDIASRENITLPADMSADERKTLDRLSKLSGAKFDSEFAKESVDDHEKDIKEFEKEAESGQNQSLKSFSSSTLPTLHDHLNMAQGIKSTK